jgi:segregation and condensation protein B
MEIGNIIPHIEALIFASDKPLTAMELTELLNNAFGFMDEKLTMEQVQTAVDGIIEKYRSEFYPFEVRESGGGLQFLTKKDYHKTVAQLNGEKFLKRLSTAALETLSIIAYKQPVTKGEIEAIRGVSSDYAIQKLLEKELIVILGRNEKMPGHPLVYGTSKNFMDYFGINSAEDLPRLKEIFDETIVVPTAVNEDEQGPEDPEAPEAEPAAEPGMLVSENGELLHGAGDVSEEADETAADADENEQAENVGLNEPAEATGEEEEGEDEDEEGEEDEENDNEEEEDDDDITAEDQEETEEQSFEQDTEDTGEESAIEDNDNAGEDAADDKERSPEDEADENEEEEKK